MWTLINRATTAGYGERYSLDIMHVRTLSCRISASLERDRRREFKSAKQELAHDFAAPTLNKQTYAAYTPLFTRCRKPHYEYVRIFVYDTVARIKAAAVRMRRK